MLSRPVRIYSVDDAPRLRYIAGIILGDILGLSWELITDKRKLGKHPIINYSDENISGALKINPAGLLSETGVSVKEIITGEWKGMPVFFQTNSDSDLPFDIFAASFYLVTRYEEYLEYEPDKHGRFPASSSLAFRKGFLQIPVIDFWAREMSKVFLKKFQNLVFRRNEYKALLTIDTDQPFAYLGKNLFRTLGGIIHDFKGNGTNATDRYNTVAKGEKDPYDVFDYITGTAEKNSTLVRFFFPVGDYSKYDKNPSWKNGEYRKLILDLSVKHPCGLHPSYVAAGNTIKVKAESQRLNEIVSGEVVSSRFHFIRMFTPQSYRNLIGAGITEDYSMGYPDEPGFRAGIARPYFFYDVTEEKETNLKIFPFQIMDATLYQYKKLDPDAAGELILNLICETKKAGGMFVSIWHNTSLLENNEWQGWRKVFESMLINQTP